jgi:hypothetical protein
MRIIPTAAEIMRGRLMRAPDHSAGDDNGSAAPAGDGDANADTGAAATGDAPGGHLPTRARVLKVMLETATLTPLQVAALTVQ